MSYTRKTRDEYDIEGDYGSGWELVTCEETYADAREMVRLYRREEPGYRFRIRPRRVPIAP